LPPPREMGRSPVADLDLDLDQSGLVQTRPGGVVEAGTTRSGQGGQLLPSSLPHRQAHGRGTEAVKHSSVGDDPRWASAVTRRPPPCHNAPSPASTDSRLATCSARVPCERAQTWRARSTSYPGVNRPARAARSTALPRVSKVS